MTAEVPPVLYVPARHAGAQQVDVALCTLPDGRVAAPAYTSLQRLVDACGAAQPWALLPADELARLQVGGAFAVVALDVDMPDGMRRDHHDG